MKRIAALLLCLTLVCAAAPALANSWGLTGKLLNAVEPDPAWNDYTTLSDQVGNAAVMHSRYHNALMLLENGELRVYTTAVYQPGDDIKTKPKLRGDAQELRLSYGKDVSFTFRCDDAGWYLAAAALGDLTVTLTEDGAGYDFRDPAGQAQWPGPIRLADFNVALFPRSAAQAQHLSRMRALLASGQQVLGSPAAWLRCEAVGKGTAPVYSAPLGKDAWRAAKGKAAVGLGGEMWLLRPFTNADGDRYVCIRYEVSQRTQRIGYISADKLQGVQLPEAGADFLSVPVTALQDTWLTDDPLCSQYAQFTVPRGTRLQCLGLLGDDYAYVEARAKNGRLGSKGSVVWGFVPLKDLAEAFPAAADEGQP